MAARELNAHAAAECKPDVQAVARIVLPTRPNLLPCRMSHEFVRWELKYVRRSVLRRYGINRIFNPPQPFAGHASDAAAAETASTWDPILIELHCTVITDPTF